MKLQEVDDQVNEGLSDWVKIGMGTLAGAAGSSAGTRKAVKAYEQSNFVNNFVAKMSGMLATVWPKILAAQQEFNTAKSMLDLMNVGKPVMYGNKQVTIDQPLYATLKAQYQRTFAEGQDQFDLSKYLLQIIQQYASSVNLQNYISEIEGLCQEVAKNYQVNRGAPSLKKIGLLIYEAIKTAQPAEIDASTETFRVKITQILPMLDRMTVGDLQKLSTEIQKKIQEKS